jgi:hypothetical protein
MGKKTGDFPKNALPENFDIIIRLKNILEVYFSLEYADINRPASIALLAVPALRKGTPADA